MKKIAGLLTVALIGLGAVSAQNFKLEANGTEVTEGATITFQGETDGWSALTCYMHITNTSDKDMEVKVAFSREGLPEGAMLMICGFGGCRTDNFVEGTIEAGGIGGTVRDPLDLSYTPDEARTPYTTDVEVTDKTSGETLMFKIHFVPLEPTANEMLAKASIAAYPNPATGQVFFRLDNVKTNARVILRDLTGKVVRATDVNGMAELTMNLNDLASGLYIYSVEENGSDVAVGKLMVR